MTNTRSKSSHGKLIAVVAAAAVVIVLAVVSAFAWPGWALRHDGADTKEPAATEPTKPAIKATALPEDATELLKAMPDSVLDYARIKADASTTWADAAPLEEYTLIYGKAKDAADVTLIVAQWSSADSAKKQFQALDKAAEGETGATGDVRVNGDITGSYVVKTTGGSDADGKDGSATPVGDATAIWQNDTVVFQATGKAADVERFYPKFPL
ncbi:hypothetical protein H7U32_05465 [Bifidobacterium pullorum subsp. saeculare]|uniref:Uncharacterized protein n=1 Tax=Bifidobacterium pullorum subsp. saeculare TaxID=78257 RepID=A0A939BAD7_9BIFI|nr:hypothetical protein [Bifidobacterium pullorum]MBM6699771.1 hypothetical protein [Bifidobacterium pullorum subsp. saeculare]